MPIQSPQLFDQITWVFLAYTLILFTVDLPIFLTQKILFFIAAVASLQGFKILII